MVMKMVRILAALSIILVTACESTDDVLDKIDHTVPAVEFSADTLEVAAGGTLVINAVIEDESGIQRIEFAYGDWRINKIIDLSEEPNTPTYNFSLEITAPEDAKKEWEETLYFNDASSIKVVQRYHKLVLSAWDRNRNLRKGIVYVMVKP
jgi:hypothetical protein